LAHLSSFRRQSVNLFLAGEGVREERPRSRTEKEKKLVFSVHMEIQQPRGVGNSKVVKVQSEEAWELFTNQASNEGRPVGTPFLSLSSPPLPSPLACCFSSC